MRISYCSNCERFKDIFSALDDWRIYEIPCVLRGYQVFFKECPNCLNTIESGTYLIDDAAEFVETVSSIIAKNLSEVIEECQSCNSDIIPYTQQHGDPMDLNLVSELVKGNDFPDELNDEIYSKITCSNCGNQLDFDQPYVTRYEVDSWYEDDVNVIVNTFDLTEQDGENFIDYLLNKPMLGLNDVVGQRIFEYIANKKIPNIVTLDKDNVFYRGRKRNNIERIAPFITDEMWNPPEGLPSQGRYNPPGISSLYLANSRIVVNEELERKNDESIDIAEFLLLEDLLVWDTRDLDIDIFNSIPSFNNSFLLKKEYVFPNFIAQCLLENKFNGIIYGSTKTDDGYNICLFSFRKNKDIVIRKIEKYDSIKDQLNPKKTNLKLPF